MDASKAREILKRYNEGTCSDEEKAWVESWYLKELDLARRQEISETELNAAKENIWAKIARKRDLAPAKPKIYPKIAVAAGILMAIGIALYFFKPAVSLFKPKHAQLSRNEISPGGDKAYLTLSDGKRINLSKLKEGELIEQAGIRIIKTSEGELAYEVSDGSSAPSGSKFNTIETPVGGQFQINLPDGTKVWLNASSTLRYPVNFSNAERKVELTGEGYFEVKSDKAKPFKVLSKNQVVEVLGTHFNINTYPDEPAVRTTLVEGSVRVTGSNKFETLKPGEQSVVRSADLEVRSVDTDQAIAWHKGDFAFEGAELREIMRQISRWYNVEVVYDGNIGDVKFGGSISRSKNINEVLKVLELTRGVSFKLEGRRVLVMP